MNDIARRLERLAAADPDLRRFGARAHRYRLGRPLGDRVAAIEREAGISLPGDYRRHVAELGNGGAGPGYGLVSLDHPVQIGSMRGRFALTEALRPPPQPDPAYDASTHFDGTLLLADHGCGYASVLVVRGADAQRGRVWLDVRGAGIGLVPTGRTFDAWYEDWLELALADPPRLRGPAPPSACSLPDALRNYLGSVEQKRGAGAGELDEEGVRAALGGIGDGGIATRSSGDRWFPAGDPLRLCLHCHAMVGRFVDRGMMRETQVTPGLPPICDRTDGEAP